MKWYAINKEYVNYLKQFDAIVPNVDYTGKLKNFLGVVFKSEYGWDYFAPLTSYKPKFRTMQNTIDFYKIVNENGKIYDTCSKGRVHRGNTNDIAIIENI